MGSGMGSGGSFGSSLTGSVNGGLAPVASGLVNLYIAGNATPIATATTNTDGSYSLSFTNPGGTSLLYLSVTGGNAGGGTNSKNQFLSMAGTTAVPLSSLKMNEMTTAATELDAMNMGILIDTNGVITLAAPKNGAGATNVVTQFNNLTANGLLNTSNSSLTSSAQTGLNAMANMFAACIEVPANCSTLFNQATTTSGAVAVSLLESGFNALNNSANTSGQLYTLAFPLNSKTGFTLTSSSTPGGFTFNNGLPISGSTFTVGNTPQGIAFDASGNLWIANQGDNTVTKVSPTGAIIGTFSAGTGPMGIAIDAGGNVWVNNFTGGGSLTELNSSGTTIGTFSPGGQPWEILFDASGNAWVVNNVNPGTVTELNASGTVLNTFNPGSTSVSNVFPRDMVIDSSQNVWLISNYSAAGPRYITQLSSSGTVLQSINLATRMQGGAIDSSGNIWVCEYGSNAVAKLNPQGTVLGTFTASISQPFGIAPDAFGNVWVTNQGTNMLTELNPAGIALANYSLSTTSDAVAIDGSGNVWVTNTGGSTITLFKGLAAGPQPFAYRSPALYIGGSI